MAIASSEFLSQLSDACRSTAPGLGLYVLCDALSEATGGGQVRPIVSRKGWQLPGGVLDANDRRVAERIIPWVEESVKEDFDDFVDTFQGQGLQVTRRAGRHHYFTLREGDEAARFLQIEVHELQEEVDRLLFHPCHRPESAGELLEPTERARLEHRAIGKPYYVFHRLTRWTEAREVVGKVSVPLEAFWTDWYRSTAGRHEHFDRHWVIDWSVKKEATAAGMLLHGQYVHHEQLIAALHSEPFPRGSCLALLIHEYDRVVGYPMAWYFTMLSDKRVPRRLALAVLGDLEGEYSYLPERDVVVVREWGQQLKSNVSRRAALRVRRGYPGDMMDDF